MRMCILLLISMLVGVSGCIAADDVTPQPESAESDPGGPWVERQVAPCS